MSWMKQHVQQFIRSVTEKNAISMEQVSLGAVNWGAFNTTWNSPFSFNHEGA